MKPRWYQKEASDAAIAYLRKATNPCIIEAPTGSGKSIIVAELARWYRNHAKKNVLCLAPSAELVQQNHEKYKAIGERASIYSASAGSKSVKHPVVFGTPLSVKNAIGKFSSEFGLIIIDEGDGITKTVHTIVDTLRAQNPNLRVVGLTATPYKLGKGYVFRENIDGTVLDDTLALNPWYHKLVYRISAEVLIQEGYLTPPVLDTPSAHYDTSGLEKTSSGQWTSASLDRAFVGRGRLTADVISDIVAKSANRRKVIIFAATIEHAKEVAESLPPQLTRMADGTMKKGDRARLVSDFKANKFKYLVNVNVFSVGFDVPDIDVVALLRHSESPRLLTQQIGRGLRLADGKTDCLILDYAQNIEKHFPDGDLFNPEIKTKLSGDKVPTVAKCPICGYENEFTYRKDPDFEDMTISEDGYFIDLLGAKTEVPAHYGRRCWGYVNTGGIYDRCNYRWTGKDCPECGHDNDIAARHCSKCKAEMVNPNDKLKIVAATNPHELQTHAVLSTKVEDWVSKAGNKTWKVTFSTELRQVTVWLPQEPKNAMQIRALTMFNTARGNGIKTITYRKEPNGFFKIYDYNRGLGDD